MKVITSLIVLVFTCLALGCADYYEDPPTEIDPIFGSFTDERDGINYETVELSGQVWMAENLRFASQGSLIKEGDQSGLQNGRYYQWQEALSVCPSGWRLPIGTDWEILAETLGGQTTAGEKMKATSGWKDNGNGNNESGFNGLPSGYFVNDSELIVFGEEARFWSNEDATYDDGWSECGGLSWMGKPLELTGFGKELYLSVRCIK